MERLGCFLCSGCGIGDKINLDDLDEVISDYSVEHSASHECLCGEEGVNLIRQAIDEHNLDGVCIAACSERAKIGSFQRAFPEFPMARVSLREQVVWSRPEDEDEEDTQLLAADLLHMGLTKVKNIKAFDHLEEQIEDTVLVVGGGRAGLEAASVAAGLGSPVVIVEKEAQLGGRLARQASMLPEEPPYDAPVPVNIQELIDSVTAMDGVTVHTSTQTAKITGQPGQFDVTLSTASGEQQIRVGAIVQATGARSYPAERLGHLGYGASPDVVTSEEFEEMLVAGKVACPSDQRTPERVAFIQCAGSRDPNHLPYCSSECCATTLRQLSTMHQKNPEIEAAVIYKDMRTPGQLEHFYLGIQSQPATLLTRGEVDAVTANGKLSVHLTESLLGDDINIDADLVVLATGMVPNAADGEAIRQLRDARVRAETSESSKQRAEAAELAEKLEEHEGTEILNLEYRQGPDLPALRYHFPDSHYICFPYETRRTGIYATGTVRAPMTAADAAADGWGAAMKAVQCVEMAKRGEAVHPRAGDTGYPDFFLQRCTQCKRCTEECPFGTLNEDEKGTPQLNVLRCRRCGICMGACPERIISFPDYSVGMVASMIKSFEVPEDYEEKPRIVALLCENDAYPAMDAAAKAGMTWNPWMRVIPVRCLGSLNIVWIAEALSRGIDGLLLIGCKHGDDYQCHYIRGSELAETRLGNVQETLQRLALEPERIKVVQLAHDEFERIPQIFDEFSEELDDLGPNPLKGF